MDTGVVRAVVLDLAPLQTLAVPPASLELRSRLSPEGKLLLQHAYELRYYRLPARNPESLYGLAVQIDLVLIA